MSSKHARRISNPLPYLGKLTLSAGVITDVTRLAGVEGDGEAYPDSSVGVWPAATNYCEYGNSAGTGWAAIGAGGLTPSTVTDWGQFGGQSIRFGGDGTINQGAHYYTPAGVATLGETWVVSCWIYSEVSRDYKVSCSERDAANGYLTESSVTVAVTAGIPLYFQCSRTFNNASVSRASIRVTADGTVGSAWEARVSGVNIEKSSIATPYIETDGGTASRVAGTITMPASVLDETQMWVAVCVTIGSTSGGPNRIFSWGDDANNRIEMILGSATNKPYMLRVAAGTGPGAAAISGTAAVGDTVVCMVGMSATSVYCGWKGQGLSEVADTNIPTISSTQPHIGRQGFGSFGWLAGSVKWCAVGKGPPTNALENLVNNFGGTDPLPHMFPRSAQLTFLAGFNGDGTAYRYAA